MTQEIVAELLKIERRLKKLESNESPSIPISENNVSNPPTDADLDSAFGTPADVGEGFIGLVDDNDANTTAWLVFSVGGSWWYEQLTKAV